MEIYYTDKWTKMEGYSAAAQAAEQGTKTKNWLNYATIADMYDHIDINKEALGLYVSQRLF